MSGSHFDSHAVYMGLRRCWPRTTSPGLGPSQCTASSARPFQITSARTTTDRCDQGRRPMGIVLFSSPTRAKEHALLPPTGRSLRQRPGAAVCAIVRLTFLSSPHWPDPTGNASTGRCLAQHGQYFFPPTAVLRDLPSAPTTLAFA